MKWEPIQSAPKDGQRILILPYPYTRGSIEIARWIGEPHNHWSIDGFRYIDAAKYWMPLPQPPETT